MKSSPSILEAGIRFCLEKKLVVFLGLLSWVLLGTIVSPFDGFDVGVRRPVPVDALPDLGENQQIVFTRWPGQSPQDVQDQITQPLTAALQGIPGVQTIRSMSAFGFSSLFVIFDESVDFYWSRSRILEKLASLSPGLLPEEVRPALGPDATALGQIFWYTLEGRDPEGNPTGGWGLEELRRLQDFHLRDALSSVSGVSEVASVGGFLPEVQVLPKRSVLRGLGLGWDQVLAAIRASNLDVGAQTLESNGVEYVVRGVGRLESLDDLRDTVVARRGHVPVTLEQVAEVRWGPAARRGVLDKDGAEVVGAVVVARYGANPLATLEALHRKMEELRPGLPEKVLSDGTVSKVEIVPFYDRSGLIHETLGTLEAALTEETLGTILVVLISVWHLKSAALISLLLPLAILGCFGAMKLVGVDANVVALSGIAIAIGTMVDMGIVLLENILQHFEEAPPEKKSLEVVLEASVEVGSAVLTSVATTVVGFLPVFAMQGAEGKLFRPLAWTKTFSLLASVVVALTLLPVLAHLLFRRPRAGAQPSSRVWGGLANGLALAGVCFGLTRSWMPLGVEKGLGLNAIFVVGLGGLVLGSFFGFRKLYPRLLALALEAKLAFLTLPLGLVVLGLSIWLGFANLLAPGLRLLEHLGVSTQAIRLHPGFVSLAHRFPGLGKEFMPDLDEGSFLYMPTTMTHASIGQVHSMLQQLDRALASIPEVEVAVGKLGRVDSALDPAPVSMIETVIQLKPEFHLDPRGRLQLFRLDPRTQEPLVDDHGDWIPDPEGSPVRIWRDEIRTQRDIWNEVVRVAKIPGLTSAPHLQPIAARLVMLQTGMRAPMGIRIRAPDLSTLEAFALALEKVLAKVPQVPPETVVADRILGKPYLHLEPDRRALAQAGISIERLQRTLQAAIGGRALTTWIEGRERFEVRVREPREDRLDPLALEEILISSGTGAPLPLGQLVELRYQRGPQVIQGEDGFLVGTVLFDKHPELAEVEVVEACQAFLAARIDSGELRVPTGVSFRFAGSYEAQQRSEKRLRILLPLALEVIFLILYLQFGSVRTTALVFAGILVAWSGGFVALWLYGQPWFLDATIFGVDLRQLFQIQEVHLSVAVWVGFLALFGIASDDGVVMATYLDQSFAERRPSSIAEIREATLVAGSRRIRPCLMTTATTLLALFPVLTSQGRGSDILVPMAIPSFGGMAFELITLFVVPVGYCFFQEREFLRSGPGSETVRPSPASGTSPSPRNPNPPSSRNLGRRRRSQHRRRRRQLRNQGSSR